MTAWERDYDRSLEVPDEYGLPICPRCGMDYERAFSLNGEVFGCEHCITEIDAYDELDRERYSA